MAMKTSVEKIMVRTGMPGYGRQRESDPFSWWLTRINSKQAHVVHRLMEDRWIDADKQTQPPTPSYL